MIVEAGSMAANRQTTGLRKWERKRDRHNGSGLSFRNLKAHLQWHKFSNKDTPTPIRPLSMSLWGAIFIQTTIELAWILAFLVCTPFLFYWDMYESHTIAFTVCLEQSDLSRVSFSPVLYPVPTSLPLLLTFTALICISMVLLLVSLL